MAARFRRWTKKTRPGPAGPLQSAPSSASLDKALTDRLKEAEEAPAQAGGTVRYRRQGEVAGIPQAPVAPPPQKPQHQKCWSSEL